MAQGKTRMDIEKKLCLTPMFRVSYPSVFQMSAYEENDPEYSVTGLFPKDTDLAPLKKAAFNAAREKWGAKEDWPKKHPKTGKGGLKWPWRDGDEEKEGKEEYVGMIFIRFAHKKKKPWVATRENEQMTDEDDFYAGCYARAKVLAFAYDKNGNKGVSFQLLGVQKLKEGEPLGGFGDPSAMFDAFDGDDDDDEVEEKPKKKSKKAEPVKKKKAKPEPEEDDDDDDDDDEVEDDEEEEEKPAPKKKGEPAKAAKSVKRKPEPSLSHDDDDDEEYEDDDDEI